MSSDKRPAEDDPMATRRASAAERPRPSLDRLPAIDAEGRLLAVIEVAEGSRNKYKFDPDLQAMCLHKALPLGSSFPYCFGFVPSTLGEDGDPLDVLVLMDEPALPGTVVPCRVLGIIEAQQSNDRGKVRNDRIVAVAESSQRYRDCRKLADISAKVLDEVEAFFVFYHQQEDSKFKPLARKGKVAALAAIRSGEKVCRSKRASA
jgi:inorganic pyrophosphatase